MTSIGGSAFDHVYLDTAQDIERTKLEAGIDDSTNTIGFRNERGFMHPGQQIPFERPIASREENWDKTWDKTPKPELSLTGNPIDYAKFTHNNMTPFFGSHVRQNVNDTGSHAVLEHFTGVTDLQQPKEEVGQFFKPQSENIYGTSVREDAITSRFNASKYKGQGVHLGEKVNVGPGLNQGYTSTPAGGFQQMNTRDFVVPKSVDELRVANKPRQTFEGRVLPGFAGTRRGVQPKVEQNRKIRYHSYDNEPRFNTTVVQTKDAIRPNINAKCTNRNETIAYTGNAGPSVVKQPEKYSNYTPEVVHKQALPSGGMRNATSVSSKEATIQYCSELKDTLKGQEHKVPGPVTSAVKRMIAPVQDIMRATIKETNIHDVRTGNMRQVAHQGTIHEQDAPKTTARETLRQFVAGGNISGNKRIVRPDVRADTTVKETTLHEPAKGHVSHGYKGQGYITNPKEARPVARQFIADNAYTGISGTATGKDHIGAYTSTSMEAPATLKEHQEEYTGNAMSDNTKPMSYEDIRNAVFNETKELVSKGRAPTKTNVKLGSGQDKIGTVEHRTPLDETNRNEKTRLTNIPLHLQECSVTSHKIDVDNDEIRQRLDPDQLKPFLENPYTQSLTNTA